MSKLSLVVSQEEVLNFSTEEDFLTVSSELSPNLNSLPEQLSSQKCSIEELLFTLRSSLSQLKSSQSQVSFLTEELLVLMKKS